MTDRRKLRVGILFGGQSSEHEISILSARNVLAAVNRSRFEPVPIGIDHRGRWLMQDTCKLLADAADPRLVGLEAGERNQYDARLHDCVHVSQAVGILGRVAE